MDKQKEMENTRKKEGVGYLDLADLGNTNDSNNKFNEDEFLDVKFNDEVSQLQKIMTRMKLQHQESGGVRSYVDVSGTYSSI